MTSLELEPSDISNLNDSDLRELVARLCEAELIRQKIQPSCVLWGGAQEAADGGLDVRVKNANPLSRSGFIPRENTGFQVKKNSMSKASCKKEMLHEGAVKLAISNLSSVKGAYIIVSGKDDCSDKMHNERLLGMQDAVKSLPNNEELLLDFYGRDRLATWLRQFPGVALWVRSKLGKPLSGWKPYGRWAATPPNQDDEFLLDEHPCVINLNSPQKNPMPIADGIKIARERLRNNGSTVRITGLSGVGKTRFAQALFESNVCENALPAANVIYADLGEDLSPTASELISYLVANDFSACVVLDNCPPDIHRKLQDQVSINQAKLNLLTIEYDISEDIREETEVIHIEPSSEKNVSRLIQKRYPALGRVNADKVAEFAGGNARVAIALASRVEADETLTHFSDEELFKRLFNQRKGKEESLLESAEVLSLVYSFNVSKSEFDDELSVLAKIGGIDRSDLYRHHAELYRRQLLQQRGNWRALLPHALANRLARRGLENIYVDEINAELFKQENLRLFISCAHRIGYLHDFEPARDLARTWILDSGPLHDITTCNEDQLSALEYITPIFPDIVLSIIEVASKALGFCSRNNNHYSRIVRLLRQIAYDDQYFDRASELILKFAETEVHDENYDSIVCQLQGLFSLYLSGTHATSERRQAFLNRLLISGNSRYMEIAFKLFQSAFEAFHWTSSWNFDFGARCRDYGWEPKTQGEKIDWYTGFIELLKPLFESKNQIYREWAKELIATNFRGLWVFAGCCNVLEDIVSTFASSGSWPEIWMSIKRTLYYDGTKLSSEVRARLEALERSSAPSDFYSEIEAYVFTNTWEHAEVRGENHTENRKEIEEKIENLGKIIVSDPNYLKKIAPHLWEKDIDALWSFGKGIALGSVDQNSTFEFLVRLMQEQKLEMVQPILFLGFIKGVYTEKPGLARQLQERVLEIQELKPHFVRLLVETPIAPWGVKKLIALARSGELEAWQFEQISNGRIHESISDADLSEMLSAINALKEGIFSTIQILHMRFFIDKNSDYVPDEKLRSIGRQAILRLLSMHRDEIKRNRLPDDRVAVECLSDSTPEAEIYEIVESLCEALESSRFFYSDLEVIINTLVRNFPEIILNRVFEDNKNKRVLAHLIFKERCNRNSSALNLAPVNRLVNWCSGNQSKINRIVAFISSYSSVDKKVRTMVNPQQVVLSDHIMKLLEISENKADIVEAIFKNTWPSSWTGSLSEILAVRSRAFSKLLDHPSPEVRELAKIKLPLIEKAVKEHREREAAEHTIREQRFE